MEFEGIIYFIEVIDNSLCMIEWYNLQYFYILFITNLQVVYIMNVVGVN